MTRNKHNRSANGDGDDGDALETVMVVEIRDMDSSKNMTKMLTTIPGMKYAVREYDPRVSHFLQCN